MAVNDSEKKTRAILESKAEKGKELQQFQEAQGQLINIQSELRNNLNEQRVISGMEAQGNQTVAQAAELLAASGGVAGGMVAAQPQSGTQSTLNKFGLKSPSSTTKTVRTSSQVQSPQKINITNNTTTTNNNNIQVTQPQIPISQPQIPIRAGAGGNDTAKFRAWVSNAFAKQNEAAAIREKEYQKREWSLTRSANKMIRKMGELGKSFAEKMSPKNLGNLLGDQLKVVMFLMGFQYLADNFGKVLNKVDELVTWFTGDDSGSNGKKNFFARFSENLGYFFGGEKGEGFLPAIKGLFSELANRITDKLDMAMTLRGEAIKEIKFPELDLSKMDLGNIIGAVGGYLGDVISTAFTGTKGLTKSALNSVKQSGRTNSLESYEDDFSHTQDASHLILNGRDTSMGDAVMADRNFKANLKMASKDYNSFGSLSNSVGSSIKQSQHLTNLAINMAAGGNVNTDQFYSGFSALKSTAMRNNGVLVTSNFIYTVCNIFGIPEVANEILSLCPPKSVRYIIVPKSMYDREQENAGTFLEGFSKNYAKEKIIQQLPGSNGLTSAGASTLGSFKKGNYVEGLSKFALTPLNVIGLGTYARSTAEAAFSQVRNLGVDDFTIKMVRVDDPRYPEEIYPSVKGKDGKSLKDENNNNYILLTPNAIRYLENRIKQAVGNDFSFDSNNIESLKILDKYLLQYGNSISQGNSVSGLTSFDETLGTVYELENMKRNMEEAYKDKWRDGRVDNLGGRYYKLFNGEESLDKYKVNDKSKIKGVEISDSEMNKNATRIMKRLIDETDLTAEQAAGLVGNLIQESRLNPQAVNKIGASGIAQWLGSRKDDFIKEYGKPPHETDLDTQIDFIIKELNGKENEAYKKVIENESNDSSVYAEIWSNEYERPVDKEANIKARQRYAADTIATFKQEIKEEEASREELRLAELLGKVSPTAAAKQKKIQEIEKSGGLIVKDSDGKESYRNLYKDLVNASDDELVGMFFDSGIAGKYDRYRALGAENTLSSRPFLEESGLFNKNIFRISGDDLYDTIDYRRENKAAQGGSETTDFGGMITSVIKNTYFKDFILGNKDISELRSEDTEHKTWRYLTRVASILSGKKLDPHKDRAAIADILREPFKKLLYGKGRRNSNFYYLLNENQKRKFINEFVKIEESNLLGKTVKDLSEEQQNQWFDYLEDKYYTKNLGELVREKAAEELDNLKAKGIRLAEDQIRDERATESMKRTLIDALGEDNIWLDEEKTKYNLSPYSDEIKKISEEVDSVYNSPENSYLSYLGSNSKLRSAIFRGLLEKKGGVLIKSLRKYFGDSVKDEDLLNTALSILNGEDQDAAVNLAKNIELEKDFIKFGIDSSQINAEKDLAIRKHFLDLFKAHGTDYKYLENRFALNTDIINTLKSGGSLSNDQWKEIISKNEGIAQEAEFKSLSALDLTQTVSKLGTSNKLENIQGEAVNRFKTITSKDYVTPENLEFIASKELAKKLSSAGVSAGDNLGIQASMTTNDLINMMNHNLIINGYMSSITNEILLQKMGVDLKSNAEIATAINNKNESGE